MAEAVWNPYYGCMQITEFPPSTAVGSSHGTLADAQSAVMIVEETCTYCCSVDAVKRSCKQ